ncbi:MAG: hypothetical protein WBE26_12005 [Phycisphaerae bacterium]
MSEDRSLELPEHIVAKIQKVLGISPSSLPQHDLVSLIEDLCDTALMFDREERGAEQTEEGKPPGETAAAATTPPSEPPSVARAPGVDSSVSDPGPTASDVWAPRRPDRRGPTASPS